MIIPFPTEWKVIKFHGSKPPTRLGDMENCFGFSNNKFDWEISGFFT